jgi:dolichol-phosphate mannosyltransferase
MTGAPLLSVVVPVYREAGNIAPFLARLESTLDGAGIRYEIIFALDPSPDTTEAEIRAAIARNSAIRLLLFSRRFGQPPATLAGLAAAVGDFAVVIDVDLQDPPELIPLMLARATEGADVVYARRRSRAGETIIKRMIAAVGYSLIARFAEVPIPPNTGDFRVLSRRVITHVLSLRETHGFLRGLVALVGFSQAEVLYDRAPRFAGRGHYNRLTGSIRIGLNGLVSFSNRPLQILWLIGFGLMAGALCMALAARVGFGSPGAAVMVHVGLVGLQFTGLGLIGEYIGRIYDVVKGRPPYIIAERVNFDQPPKGGAGGEKNEA